MALVSHVKQESEQQVKFPKFFHVYFKPYWLSLKRMVKVSSSVSVYSSALSTDYCKEVIVDIRKVIFLSSLILIDLQSVCAAVMLVVSSHIGAADVIECNFRAQITLLGR